MESLLRKIKPRHYPVLTFILTCMIYACIFSATGFLGGDYVIAKSDLYHQYLAFLKMFVDVLKGEGSYWFSWNVGMGSNTALLHAYYTLSPFNLLCLLFGEQHMMTAVFFIIVGKAGLSACTYQIFASRFLKQKGFVTVLFAMMYGLCGYVVCYYVNIMWMDAVYLFPVLMLLAVRLAEKRKSAAFTIALLFLFGINFYSAYMAGIGLFIFFAGYLLYAAKRLGIKNCIKAGILFSLSVLTALAATAVIWLPAFLSLLAGGSGDVRVSSGNVNNPLLTYGNLFIGEMQSFNGFVPFVYCGIPCLLLLPFYVINRRIPRREKWIVGALLLLWLMITSVSFLDRALHGFDEPNMFPFRYSYIISFLIITIACRQSLYLNKVSQKGLLAVILFNLLLYAGLGVFLPQSFKEQFSLNSLPGFFVNLAFMVVWLLAVLVYQQKILDKLALCVLTFFLAALELTVNGAMCIEKQDHVETDQMIYSVFSQTEKATIERLLEDQGWYRSYYSGISNRNAGAMYGYQRIGFFSSSRSAALIRALSGLGYLTGENYVSESGYTEVTLALLGVKYRIDGFSMAKEGTVSYQPIEEYPYYLSVGYMTDEQIREYAFTESPFENQNNLLTAMLGREIVCFEAVPAQLQAINGKVNYYENGSIILASTPDSSDTLFRFEIPPDEDNQPLYGYFSRVTRDRFNYFSVVRTPDLMENNEITHAVPRLDDPRILRLGIGESGNYEVDITFTDENMSDYIKKAYFNFYKKPVFEEAMQELQKEQLTVTQWRDGYLKGTIEVSGQREVLFTSIPYDSGWEILVDGAERPAIALMDEAFLGVELTEGYHEVIMQYTAPGSQAGSLISLFTIIVWGGITVCRRILRKH